MRTAVFATVLWSALLGAPAAVAAQAPGASPATLPATAVTPPQAPAPLEGGAYTYQPDGRRDPFMSLVGTGTEPRVPTERQDGPAGLLVSEVSVRGVLQSQKEFVAMVQGPDNKTYVIHQGDKFVDGVVKSVTAQGLVIVQDVNDPLSLVKQREVRKLLRPLEDAK